MQHQHLTSEALRDSRYSEIAALHPKKKLCDSKWQKRTNTTGDAFSCSHRRAIRKSPRPFFFCTASREQPIVVGLLVPFSQLSFDLQETWAQNVQRIVIKHFMNVGKGWFDMYETSKETYDYGKLKKMLLVACLIMQDSLR